MINTLLRYYTNALTMSPVLRLPFIISCVILRWGFLCFRRSLSKILFLPFPSFPCLYTYSFLDIPPCHCYPTRPERTNHSKLIQGDMVVKDMNYGTWIIFRLYSFRGPNEDGKLSTTNFIIVCKKRSRKRFLENFYCRQIIRKPERPQTRISRERAPTSWSKSFTNYYCFVDTARNKNRFSISRKSIFISWARLFSACRTNQIYPLDFSPPSAQVRLRERMCRKLPSPVPLAENEINIVGNKLNT